MRRWIGPIVRPVVGVMILGLFTLASGDAKRDARADELYAEGKALLATNLLQACEKFDQSLRENPAAIGTLLNVALCDERLGRIASAVAKFTEARDRAREQGLDEHVRAAEQHIAALAPEVPHLTLQLAEALADTKILVDDRVIPLESLADIPIDPGERAIVVSAPARLPYRTTVIVARSEHKRVVIPALARSVTVTSSRRRIGQITSVVGVAALGTGLGLGLYADHLYDKQFDDHRCDHLPTGDRCQPSGQSRTERARSLGNVGTVVGLTGLALAGVGAYLWLSSPRSTEPSTLTVAPQVSSDTIGVTALGQF